MRTLNKLGTIASAGLILAGCANAGQPTPEPTSDTSDSDAPAVGELEPVEYKKDGTVSVGDRRYSTVEEFQQSDEFRSSGRRCASNHPPVAAFDPSDCSFTFTSIQPDYQPDAVYEIPVVFHVIQKQNGTGFVPEDLVRSQVDVLNEDFQALPNSNGANGLNAKIRFVLASEDPDGNATDGINYITNNQYFTDPGPGTLSDMKEDLAWDTENYFNIYTNDASGALGYATFPTQSAGTKEDGIVLLPTSVGKNAPNGGQFNLGRTATHEVGHYLGLFHTFQDGCGDSESPYSTGDLIAETQAHSGPNFECNVQASSCGGGNVPLKNYMNYTPDACMEHFKAEQANRMRCSMIHYRSELYEVVGGGGGGGGDNTAPTAGFDASTMELAVDFTDTSADSDGQIAAWDWDFGDGATSTDQNPSHTYDAAGTYTVSLTVTDDDGATATSTVDVDVTETPDTTGELTSGEPVTGLSGGKNDELRFFIDVPEGSSNVTFDIAGGSGDADLYIRHGAEPTTSQWDYRPYDVGNDETVSVDAPEAGRWHVMVRGYTSFDGVSLEAVVSGGGGGGGDGFQTEIPDLSGADDEGLHFDFDVPEGASNLRFAIAGGSGDADLYVKHGSEATEDDWDFRPFLFGNEENVTVDAPDAGAWHVMVHGYNDFSGVTLSVSYDQ